MAHPYGCINNRSINFDRLQFHANFRPEIDADPKAQTRTTPSCSTKGSIIMTNTRQCRGNADDLRLNGVPQSSLRSEAALAAGAHLHNDSCKTPTRRCVPVNYCCWVHGVERFKVDATTLSTTSTSSSSQPAQPTGAPADSFFVQRQSETPLLNDSINSQLSAYKAR